MSSSVRCRWNLSKISDKLDESMVLGFDTLEWSGDPCKLSSKFDERNLIHARWSRAQIDENSKDDQAPGSLFRFGFLF